MLRCQIGRPWRGRKSCHRLLQRSHHCSREEGKGKGTTIKLTKEELLFQGKGEGAKERHQTEIVLVGVSSLSANLLEYDGARISGWFKNQVVTFRLCRGDQMGDKISYSDLVFLEMSSDLTELSPLIAVRCVGRNYRLARSSRTIHGTKRPSGLMARPESKAHEVDSITETTLSSKKNNIPPHSAQIRCCV